MITYLGSNGATTGTDSTSNAKGQVSTYFSYLGGGGLNVGGLVQGPSAVNSLGSRDWGYHFGPVDSLIFGVLPNVTLGVKDQSPFHGLLNFWVPNLPSGFSTLGVATFGSGKQKINYIPAADYSGPSVNSRFVYFQPSAPVSRYFEGPSGLV